MFRPEIVTIIPSLPKPYIIRESIYLNTLPSAHS